MHVAAGQWRAARDRARSARRAVDDRDWAATLAGRERARRRAPRGRRRGGGRPLPTVAGDAPRRSGGASRRWSGSRRAPVTRRRRLPWPSWPWTAAREARRARGAGGAGGRGGRDGGARSAARGCAGPPRRWRRCRGTRRPPTCSNGSTRRSGAGTSWSRSSRPRAPPAPAPATRSGPRRRRGSNGWVRCTRIRCAIRGRRSRFTASGRRWGRGGCAALRALLRAAEKAGDALVAAEAALKLGTEIRELPTETRFAWCYRAATIYEERAAADDEAVRAYEAALALVPGLAPGAGGAGARALPRRPARGAGGGAAPGRRPRRPTRPAPAPSR